MSDFDWKGLIKSVAPTAATLLGGPLAGLAVKALGDAMGISDATQEKIESALQSGQLAGEQLAAIKLAEQNLKLELKKLDINLEEIHAKDRDSARKLQAETKSWVPAALTVLTIGGFFWLLIGAAMGEFKLTGSDVMMLLLGVLARETAGVYQFWFGSSSGSQRKTDMLTRKD